MAWLIKKFRSKKNGVLLTLLALIILSAGSMVGLYQTQAVYSAELLSSDAPSSKESHMKNNSYNNLDETTREMLAAIEHTQKVYDAETVLETEEVLVRARLRISFEQYAQALRLNEEHFGLSSTERSREVVQIAIGDFMESEDSYSVGHENIVKDLEVYSRVMTETLIQTSVAVL